MKRDTFTSDLIKSRQDTKKNVSCNEFALASNVVISFALDVIDNSLKYRVNKYDQIESIFVNVDWANVTQIRLDDFKFNSLIVKTCDSIDQFELNDRQRRIVKKIENTMLRVTFQNDDVIATSVESQVSL